MKPATVELRREIDAHLPPVSMEHRFGQRLRCGSPVRLSAGDGVGGAGRLRDVSLSGAFLETALDPPLFAPIDIAATHPAAQDVCLRALVVRKDRHGVGVEWCETPGRSICQIFGCTRQCEVT